MPKTKDEEKRKKILSRGKRLFADPTGEGSLKELARLTETTASNLYTYFPTKTDLIGSIIEKDWSWMEDELGKEGDWNPSPENIRRSFTGKILAELLADPDLCSLIVRYPNAVREAAGKLEAFQRILGPAFGEPGIDDEGNELDEREEQARNAILVLGALCSITYAQHANIPFSEKDVLQAFRSFFLPRSGA